MASQMNVATDIHVCYKLFLSHGLKNDCITIVGFNTNVINIANVNISATRNGTV